MKHNLIFAFITFFSLEINAQNLSIKKIDSLLNIEHVGWDLKKNVKFLENLYSSSEKANYEKGKYRSLVKRADWYMLKGQYENAIPILDKIVKLPIKDSKNYTYKIRALQNQAFAYNILGFYNDAQVVNDRAFHLIPKVRDQDKEHKLRGDGYDIRSAIYVEMKKPEDSVLSYLMKATSEYKKIKNTPTRKVNLKTAYINISTSFLEMKKSDSALLYSYMVLAMDEGEEEKNEASSYIFQTIGMAHLQKNNLDSALIYFKKSESILKKTGDPNALKVVYQTLSRIYEKQNDKKNSLLYSRKQNHLLDSLSSIVKKGANKALQIIKKDIQQENRKSKNKLYVVIGGVLIILCVIIFFLWKFFKNFRQERKFRLENEEMISEKVTELNYTKSKMNDAFEEVIVLAKNNDPAFLARFKEVYPEFFDGILRLYPDILNSEFIFCAYLKLNFSTKEIATYTFVTPKAVQNRKNRIRKKLNIPSDEDIYIWMSIIGG